MDEVDDISQLRQQVRDVDDQLYKLMARRLELAKRIGAVKHAANLPIKDYRVEKDVIERARARARQLGLYETMAEEAARLLIKYAVTAQDEYRQQRNRLKAAPSEKILIAGGRGGMGRWLSEFFESFGHAVSHFDPPATKGAASPYPLIADLAEGASSHDVVVLATPISATANLIERLAELKTKALVFDICSLKSPLIDSIRKASRNGLRVASVHPMFGPQVDVLSGRNILICDAGDAKLTASAKRLFEGTTANLVEIPLERHDELMGYVLGLSHLTSLVFADVLAKSEESFQALKEVASTTFNAQLDVSTNVVRENQDLYFEIQAENAFTPELVKALAASLKNYGAAIEGQDRQKFRALMAAAKKYLTD